MKKLDYIIGITGLVLAGVLYLPNMLNPKNEGAYAVVYEDGTEKARFSLSDDGTYVIESAEGINELKIENNMADMVYADCRDKICVNHSAISKQNESIICLPHKIVVEIEGGEESDIDAVAK